MEPTPSQQTLGLLREILEEMQPDEIYSAHENTKFWKDVLFRFGLPLKFIELASTYNFRWSDIIPDLHAGKLGNMYSSTSAYNLPVPLCTEALQSLLRLALQAHEIRADELREHLLKDGLDLEDDSGLTAPSPGPTELVANVTEAKVPRMADKQREIVQQFATILFKAQRNQNRFYSMVVGNRLVPGASEPGDPIVTEHPERWKLSDEQVVLLGRLYLLADAAIRTYLQQLAKTQLGPKPNWPNYSGHIFIFLAHFYSSREALSAVLNGLEATERGWYTLLAVSNFLKCDHAGMKDDELDEFISKVFKKRDEVSPPTRKRGTSGPFTPSTAQVAHARVASVLNQIIRQIQEIKYIRLRKDLLRDANLEINQDKESLEQELRRFGFSEELIKSLEHAEAEYRKAESDFDFKTASDHNRTFFETLLRQVAVKVSAIRKEALTIHTTRAVEVREYLKNTGFLTEKIHKLCETFYGFASDESTHKLSSGREVARIVRNMNIELALLLVQRLNAFVP